MSKGKRKHSIVLPVMILICALVAMGIAGYKLWEHEREEADGREAYEELSEYAHIQEGPEKSEENKVTAPKIDVDFEALEKVNPDTIGWLYSPDTVINYPVMKAKDYKQYLHRLPNGKYNRNGSLFLDFNCKSDFSGRLNIIYGHHMKSGRMFASLVEYKKQSYYESHPYVYLYTKEHTYRIELKYGCVVGAGEWKKKAFMYEENTDALLEYAREKTTFKSGVEIGESDRIMVLSTCSYEFNGARYMVVGKLAEAS